MEKLSSTLFLWSDFDLVVIDESHNFRNNDTNVNRETKTRYERLMDDIIKQVAEQRY